MPTPILRQHQKVEVAKDELRYCTTSRPSSAMASVTWQQLNPSTSLLRPESCQSERHVLRRQSSHPEFFKPTVASAGSNSDSPVSSTSLLEGTSDLELHQSRPRQEEMHFPYPAMSNKLRVMSPEQYNLFPEGVDGPRPSPRLTLVPSSNVGRSKLYVRRSTPSPLPRRPSLLTMGGSMDSVGRLSPPPLPARSVATPVVPPRSVEPPSIRTRPPLRPQRSFSPIRCSQADLLVENSSQEKLNAWKVEYTRLPTPSRQMTKASMEVSEDSDNDISTDSSCEDLPIPRLRSHLPLGTSPTQVFTTRKPEQSVPPASVSFQQHHRYLKSDKAPGITHSKMNYSPLQSQQRVSQVGRRLRGNEYPAEAFPPPLRRASTLRDIPQSPQPVYPQNHHYDELWRSTAESIRLILMPHLNVNLPSTPAQLANELRTGIYLAQFLNNFLDYKAIKKIREITGSSWKLSARELLLKCREVIHKVGVPKHRLFSVTLVMAGDMTVGLLGLLHCLQTLLEVCASRSSIFLTGGLGVREKLSNQPTNYRSLLGDITATRRQHYQHHRYRAATPNNDAGAGGCDGVFSDV